MKMDSRDMIGYVFLIGSILFAVFAYKTPSKFDLKADVIYEYHHQGYWYLAGHILKDDIHVYDCPTCHPGADSSMKYHDLIMTEDYFHKNPQWGYLIKDQIYRDKNGNAYEVGFHNGCWCLVYHGYRNKFHGVPLATILGYPEKLKEMNKK